jgi:cytochrome c biogenesis protein CcdA/thiol-disulfide isomerase/thioredoxin
MLILIGFAFIAGIVTILSPCILPILPVVLSGTVSSGKRKPFGIVAGFIFSFTFFTLVTTALVKATGLDADLIRIFSILLIAFLGLSLVVPRLQKISETYFSKLSSLIPRSTSSDGFWGGVLIGLSIGIVWTPCVGPILAAVIALSQTTSISYAIVLITISYALGTAIPMIGIIYFGKALFAKVPFLLRNLAVIQKGFGVLMIITAFLLFTNADRKFQEYVLKQFPTWGTGLTTIEDNKLVKDQLDRIKDNTSSIKIVPEKQAPAIIAGGEWFNSNPLTISELKGKVVLIDFWTYTCINCIRTLPYIESWHEKYADKGLVIIGVHSPEFEFEKNAKNVKKAISDFGLKYPIVQDNNFDTWKNYNNRYWPAKYLIDANGAIQYTHFGEGNYNETELEIQKLLKQKDESIELGKIENKEYKTAAKTPELYLGYSRIQAIEVNQKVEPGKVIKYTPAYSSPSKNMFDWSGEVLISDEYANPAKGAKLRLNYEAKEVFLVMRPLASSGTLKIQIDGKQIDLANAGEDIKDGVVTIDTDRLYKLIKSEKTENHILTIEFLDSNTEIFAFTFG